MHGHSFERIWTKFGLRHPYTLRMVTGVGVASAARARGLALHELGNSELASGGRKGSSAVDA